MIGLKSFATSLAIVVLIGATAALAQGPARGPIEAARDPIMEVTAKHNLEVARWYLTKRKAYAGARDRLQEIMDTYAEFSRMDEVVYLMGEVHIKLDKQDQAVEYFDKLVKVYPDSQFAKKAKERLQELKKEPVTLTN